uniref:AtmCHH1 preproprotein n=1 Tax=Atyopsis moluccensis TaxID=395616 RepID=A0A2Z1U6V3_9EUCA|nr:AtmCHH1 preproprotein [Atyopsis moluccensis]
MVCSAMMVVVLVLCAKSAVQARSVDGVSRIEKLLSSSSSSSAQPSALSALGSGHSLDKRAVFDQSCKGIYDRELFRKLERVCEDCYNLYRKPYVGIDCRNNCYSNLVFRQCLDDLLMFDVLDEYVNAVQMVGK